MNDEKTDALKMLHKLLGFCAVDSPNVHQFKFNKCFQKYELKNATKESKSLIALDIHDFEEMEKLKMAKKLEVSNN